MDFELYQFNVKFSVWTILVIFTTIYLALPFTLMTALILSRIDEIRAESFSGVIFPHSSFTAFSISTTFASRDCFWTASFMIFHKFPIRFRSGHYAGQLSFFTSTVSCHCFEKMLLQMGTPSSIMSVMALGSSCEKWCCSKAITQTKGIPDHNWDLAKLECQNKAILVVLLAISLRDPNVSWVLTNLKRGLIRPYHLPLVFYCRCHVVFCKL